jgi:hypothetical protein
LDDDKVDDEFPTQRVTSLGGGGIGHRDEDGRIMVMYLLTNRSIYMSQTRNLPGIQADVPRLPSLVAPQRSFLKRHLSEERTMKARLLKNSLQNGHIARDYIRLVQRNQGLSTADVAPEENAAHAVLESFEHQDRSTPADSIVPIKPLVRGLTESLRGTSNLVADDKCRIDGASLYRGCPVQIVGIPERLFIVRDVYWDYAEVRIKQKGKSTEYVLPWDCLRFVEEPEE